MTYCSDIYTIIMNTTNHYLHLIFQGGLVKITEQKKGSFISETIIVSDLYPNAPDLFAINTCTPQKRSCIYFPQQQKVR